MYQTISGISLSRVNWPPSGLVLAIVLSVSAARAESALATRASGHDELPDDPSHLSERQASWVKVSVRQHSEGWANPRGGFNREIAYTGALSLGAKMDLSALTTGLSGGVEGLWLQGDNPSSRAVGDAGGVSNVAGLATVRLFQLWLEWMPLGERGSVKVGQLAIDDDFMVLPSAQLFSNSGFGTPQTFALNVPAPIYPLGALGVRVRLRPHGCCSVLLGLYDLDAGSESTSRHFADFRLSSRQGALALAEVSGQAGPFSQWSVGGFQALAPEGEPSGGQWAVGAMSHLYAMMQQTVAVVGGSQVNVFAHAAVAVPTRRAVVVHQLDAGVVLSGELWNRPQDDLGVGVIVVGFGQAYLNNAREVGEVWAPTERVGELTYAFRWRPWAQAAPTLQWVGDPHFSRRDSVVVGLRLTVER